MKIYATFDKKARFYSAPLAFVNDEVAKRSFISACTSPNSQMASIKDDIELYYIGEYVESTAVLVPDDKILIITGLEVMVNG